MALITIQPQYSQTSVIHGLGVNLVWAGLHNPWLEYPNPGLGSAPDLRLAFGIQKCRFDFKPGLR